MTSIFSIPPVAANGGDHTTNMNEQFLRTENQSLQKQVVDSRQKIQSLVKRLSSASADVAKSVHSVATYDILDARLSKCTTERDAAVSTLQASRNENADLKNIVDELEKQVQELEQSHKRDTDESNEKIDALKNMLQSVSAQVTETACAKEAVEAKFKVSQERVGNLELRVGEQNRMQKTLEENLKMLSTERFDLTKKVSSMGTTIMANEKEHKQLETKVAGLAYEKQSLTRDLGAAQVKNKTLVESRDSLIVTGAGKSKTIEAQYGRIQKLDMDKAQANVELTRLKHHIDMIFAEIEEYKAVLDQTQRNMKDREMTAQQAQAELETRLTALNQQKESLKGDVNLTISYLAATREEVANLRNTVQERDQRIEEEKEKLASLAGSETTAVLNEGGKITLSFTDGHF